MQLRLPQAIHQGGQPWHDRFGTLQQCGVQCVVALIGRRSRYGDQVLALVFVVLRRSSAAHAALDLTGAKNLKANTCQPSHLLLRRRIRLDAIQDGLDHALCH
ncbi:hypothetical protein, partial [Pseudomonas parafulva]|uniref:hypothetical protein n=1 Tax=Pseudomonas parafulva TaxID=157782 RepID=UPI000792BB5F